MHLFVAVLFGRLAFVQSLERAVVLLVEPPALLHRDPVLTELVQHRVKGLHGPFQIGYIGFPEPVSLSPQQFAGFGGLGLAALAQIDIGPSRKPVFAVPDALAVAEQYDLLHGFRFHAFTGSGQTRLVSSLPA